MENERPITRRSLLPTKKTPAAAKKPGATRQTFTVEIENDMLVLRMPLIAEDKRKKSKSGKSIICAGTSGTRVARHEVNGAIVPLEIAGRVLRVCATAWISAEQNVASDANPNSDKPITQE